MQFALLIFSFLFAFVSCTKDETKPTVSDLATLKLSYQGTDLASNGANFIIPLPVGSSTTSVSFTLKVSPKAKLYEGTSTTPLTLTGDSIRLTKDLTSAVSYKVVSESGKISITYTIKAEARQATSKNINGFSFLKSKNASLAEDISGTVKDNIISVSLPYGTVKTALVPTINHNGKSINPLSDVSQDFSSDKTYTVTAEDNSTQAYTIKVSLLAQTTYTVSFETNGGTPAINPIVVGSGEKATKPSPDPTKQDSVFGGWYSDPAKTQLFDFNTAITASVTLYAKWTPILYAVTFNSNGGSAVGNQSVASGTKATRPTDPTLAGNQFAGWYKESTFATPFDFATPITASVTLYAKWLKVYNFTFAKGTVRSDIVGYDISIKADGNVVKTETNYTSNAYTFVASSSITNTTQLEVSVQAKKAGNIIVGNDTIRFAGSATDAKTLTLATVGATIKFTLDWADVYNNKVKNEPNIWPPYVSVFISQSIATYLGSFFDDAEFQYTPNTSKTYEKKLYNRWGDQEMVARIANRLSTGVLSTNIIQVTPIEGETVDLGTITLAY